MLNISWLFKSPPKVEFLRLTGRRLVQVRPGEFRNAETGRLILKNLPDELGIEVLESVEQLGASVNWSEKGELHVDMPPGENAAKLSLVAERKVKHHLRGKVTLVPVGG